MIKNSHLLIFTWQTRGAIPDNFLTKNTIKMKKIIHTLSILLLAFAFTAPTFAAEKKNKKAPSAIKVPKGIELTDEQKTKVDALNKEFGPKLAACRKEAAGVITADQKKARSEAMKAAKAAGKKGKELRAAAEAASKVTEDQKQKLTECKKAMGALQKEIRGQLAGILTDEQKAKLKGGKKK
jgi:Spy/CpxP family protein refolding chaperone